MTLTEPLPLEYELQPDQTCQLCNPLAVVDFETTCVVVKRRDNPRAVAILCVDCVRFMKRAWNSGAPQTNASALATWRKRNQRDRGRPS